MITVESDSNLEELEVRDIHTGETLHTMEFAGRGFTTVASGSLVNVEHVSDTASRLRAVDVATGERRWSEPIDYREFDDPFDEGFQLTDDGDIHTTVVDRGKGNESRASVSYIIDSATGKTTAYSARYRDEISGSEERLRGDTLLTVDDECPAIVNVSTGKVVWRSKNPGDEVVNAGGVVFAPIYDEDPDRLLDRAVGSLAVDSETGENLWARKGTVGGDPVVAGDEVVAVGFGPYDGDERPIQVFDRDTGKGKWQLDGGSLVGHTFGYFVFSRKTGDDTAEVTIVSRD